MKSINGRVRILNIYRAGHSSLAGRTMFGWYPDDQPDGVMQIVQDPLVDGEKIKRCVTEGIIVRTRTDADTQEARRKDSDGAMQSAARYGRLSVAALMF